MQRDDLRRQRLHTRHRIGTIGGYVAFGFALLSLLTATSEGTPFGPADGALMVVVTVFVGYALGWAAGPFVSATKG